MVFETLDLTTNTTSITPHTPATKYVIYSFYNNDDDAYMCGAFTDGKLVVGSEDNDPTNSALFLIRNGVDDANVHVGGWGCYTCDFAGKVEWVYCPYCGDELTILVDLFRVSSEKGDQ